VLCCVCIKQSITHNVIKHNHQTHQTQSSNTSNTIIKHDGHQTHQTQSSNSHQTHTNTYTHTNPHKHTHTNTHITSHHICRCSQSNSVIREQRALTSKSTHAMNMPRQVEPGIAPNPNHIPIGFAAGADLPFQWSQPGRAIPMETSSKGDL